MDISWIIISILFFGLIIFLLFENRPRKSKKHYFEINSDFSFQNNTGEIISIRIYLNNKKTNLEFLINEFKNHNILLNKNGVFEKSDNGKIMFTIANLYEPGYFQDALNIRGLTFFFVTSNPIDNKKILNNMFNSANKINKEINGRIYNDDGQTINENNYLTMLKNNITA